MKNVAIATLTLLTVISVSACTKKTNSTPTPSSSPTMQQETQSNNMSAPDNTQAAEKPLASFTPTNDEDVTAMDKAMESVSFNEYNPDSLEDLQ